MVHTERYEYTCGICYWYIYAMFESRDISVAHEFEEKSDFLNEPIGV